MKKYTSLAQVREDLSANQITCLSLVQGYLQTIEERSNLNAFLEVFAEEAQQRAKDIDERLAKGEAGRLAGMVIALKDNICYNGHKVSASSKILEGFESVYSATVVERLLAEDAIIIGRVNCDEFAMGSSNENSAFGPVLNPIDEKRVPGGSSGGSSAAVAANMCLAALGSDTGGSIRQPASFTGVVGLKPTYGRISRWGLIAYGSSLDQIGPLTHSVEDAALLLEVMAGSDEFDTTASTKPVDAYSTMEPLEGSLRIAYVKETLEHPGIDAEVKQAVLDRIEKLKEQGHQVEPVSFPFIDEMVPTYYVISNAEASSNLSRFDGMRYGYRSEDATDTESTYALSRTEGFGPEVKRRIMLGTFVLSAGYYDAYYGQAQKVRRLIDNRTREIFADYDFILTPTTPHPAFEIGAKADDPLALYLEDIFTVHANLAGNQAISLPLINNHSSGMPVGVQLMANRFEEARLLSFASEMMNNEA